MKRKTISYGLNELLWYIVYALPLFAFLIINIKTQGTQSNYINFETIMENIFMVSQAKPPFFEMFKEMYNILGWTINNGITYYMCYLMVTYLLHLFFDVVMFIAKLAHKWLNSFTKSE